VNSLYKKVIEQRQKPISRGHSQCGQISTQPREVFLR